MNAQEAEKQIKQMIAFIRQEAKEKAEEIMVKTDSAYTAKKLSLQTEQSIELEREFKKKEKGDLAQKKKTQSRAMSEALFEKIKHRNELMTGLKQKALGQLALISQNPQYPNLVKFLLVQCFMRAMEQRVVIRCRKEDTQLVQAQLQPAVSLFKEIIFDATKCEVTISPEMDTKSFLPPAPVEGKEGLSCCGGVVLFARGGKIKCDNTLDARLDISMQDLQPDIRSLLFGAREAPKVKGSSHESDEKKHDD